jgi:hypothetical protein
VVLLARAGALAPGEHRGLGRHRELLIEASGERLVIRPRQFRGAVVLTQTPCHFGSSRPWFHCPELGCDRRVRKLYFTDRWMCRSCTGLPYRSKSQDTLKRRFDRALANREKLGGAPNALARFPRKPPNMHWDTYLCMRAESLAAERDYLTVIGARSQVALACLEQEVARLRSERADVTPSLGSSL